MIDPSAQHGMICFTGCDDGDNFRYCRRDGGAMLANCLNDAFGLVGLRRRFGRMVVA